MAEGLGIDVIQVRLAAIEARLASIERRLAPPGRCDLCGKSLTNHVSPCAGWSR
jgi:hypothetical protein